MGPPSPKRVWIAIITGWCSSGATCPWESPEAGAIMITLDRNQTMKDAYRCMHQHNIRHLGVTENKEVVGILSVKDFANYYYHEVENEATE